MPTYRIVLDIDIEPIAGHGDPSGWDWPAMLNCPAATGRRLVACNRAMRPLSEVLADYTPPVRQTLGDMPDEVFMHTPKPATR